MADDDDSTVVTVTGDPSEGEEVVAVGTGDTVKESEQDARENPDFDFGADDDDDGGSSSSRSPGGSGSRNNSGSSDDDSTVVTVTGDPSKGETVQAVGQGNTTFQSELDAAANPRFDAAQGDSVDALETRLGTGQGDGTSTQKILDQQRRIQQNQRNNERVQTSQSRKRQKQKDKQQFQPFQRARQLQAARQKKNQRIQQVKKESGLPGKSLITGVEIMQAGQKFGDQVAEKTVGRLEDPLEDLFNPEIVTETGQTVENQKLEENLQSSVSKVAERRTESFRDVSQDFTSGVAGGLPQLIGLGVATPGAVARATREKTPSIATGAVKGAELTTKEFSKDPSKFIAEETGEEVAEAAAGALIGGPVGAAVGATPIPEVTPSIQTKAVEGERFLRGDLGTQVEKGNEVVVTKPFPPEGSAQSATFKRKTKQLEGGGRGQLAIRVNPGDETVTVGQRKETPVTRRDVLRENLDAGKETVDTFLSGNAVGMGPGALLPDETSPNVEPETEPETLPEQDLFKDTETGGETFVGQARRPDLETGPKIDTSVQEDVELSDTPVQETPPDRKEEPVFEPPELVPELENPPSLENPPRTPVLDNPITPDTPFLEPPTTEPPTTPTPGPSQEQETNDNILGFTDSSAAEESSAAPSVDAILFGDTTDEEVEDDTVFSGFETREVTEDFDLF